MKKIIAADQIEKVYGQGGERRKVLNGVSVSINEGEFVSVMGPSGSGKSTLLFAVSGMDTVDSGKVFFDGRELGALQENELADLRRRRMGFVFQQPTLLKNMNLLDNIILPAMRDHRKSVKRITERARALMKKTGIEGLEKRDITQVSGGQLQRAGICRALLGSPQILFGDEPTGALNQEAAEGIMSLFAEIHETGTAVMLVTHDARIAAKTERILFMCDGQIVSEMRLPKFRETELEERMERVVLRMRELGI
ncbi:MULTISPECIES: ABC transporter ATP-binding protein [unclassified Paenibacillus]|uniref:ABC transporter ATP-binding protein n=1 Tax=unclassified Paenibacillus TaxID=185978 RepID=UPI002406B7C6|nr:MULTISPECIES: ABC transporter ATP-binding protein [unclassified Paenibacillus]MDF9840640.1 putative ABC transport system ATP-binding protein [Paenibacillus sp. PastF-2]MDF9847223.1 putative ABC transport system ATP-binding protein [Paenibacillus sp. PastM-2]MDF9853794.1 putative ABC transport system ATP-binding protein [Paenibacillus sp. PastF-1]MDH6478720.1 putative ABC transport system ATP-binding protein [Paenibacillus sp. PastH-2]MDH6506452.1 putative ABC transport system ATP-binding pr